MRLVTFIVSCICDSYLAAVLLGQLATAMGKPVDRFVKIVSGPLMEVWGDNKKVVRDAVTTTLDAW